MYVPVIIIEDYDINPSLVSGPLKKGMSEGSFIFKLEQLIRVEGESKREIFDRCKRYLSGEDVEEWGKMRKRALVFVDLNLGCPLAKAEWDELLVWFGTRDNDPPALQLNGREQGLYLAACTIVKNNNWEGVLMIATTQQSGDVKDVWVPKLRDAGQGRVHVGLTGGLTEFKTSGISLGRGIQKFVQIYGKLENRLWEEGEHCIDSPKRWYTSASDVPHHWKEEKREACKRAFESYLKTLFRFEPPSHWFIGEELKVLHRELKGLVGAHAIAHSGETAEAKKKLPLGGAVIILAAVMMDKAKVAMNSVHFRDETDAILPNQSKDQAQASILALAALFEEVSTHEKSNSPLLRSVNLKSNVLQIVLDFDCTEEKSGERSLLDKARCLFHYYESEDRTKRIREVFDGSTFLAYLKFVLESSKSVDGKESKCIVNIKPLKHENGEVQTMLEIVPCRRRR